MKIFAKVVSFFSMFALGYFLTNFIFGWSTISRGNSLLAVIFFYIVGLVCTKYLVMNHSEREIRERVLLFSKIQNQVIQALDKQAELVYVIVAKRMHPKAGVYYDVVTGTDFLPADPTNAKN